MRNFQLLGLCPLLAVSTNAAAALGLAIATACTLVAAAGAVASVRGVIARDIRLPVFVVIIATVVGLVEVTMRAWRFELAATLGLFVPLIVTNCLVLAHLESAASREAPGAAVRGAVRVGLGFAAVIVPLGALRELVATGCLLSGAELLGLSGAGFPWCLGFPGAGGGNGWLLAALPPGAFLALAVLYAARNLVGARLP